MTEAPIQLTLVATLVEDRLQQILDSERASWKSLDPSLDEPLDDLASLVLGGGKRIRPAYCFWGWVLGGGDPGGDTESPIECGCALELLHAFALAHDDVMDGSPTRRGSPTVWRRFIDRHQQREWRGEARRFGEAAAVLVGDMAMVMADRALGPVNHDVRTVWDALRTELNMGQYLDVVRTAQGQTTADQARIIIENKTAGYTVVRPLQLGAALAGRSDLADAIVAHGRPLGTAFQLRDDVLGAFGDPSVTGKPVGDDLREGKPTVLLARARATADSAQLEILDAVGREPDEDMVAAMQRVFIETGALSATEAEIDELFGAAMDAVDALPEVETARDALSALAHFVVAREA